MQFKTQFRTWLKKPKEPGVGQQAWAYLLLLPLVLFTLSGFTFLLNAAPTPRIASGTPQLLTSQMSVLHVANAADDGCTDVVYIAQVSLKGIKIYFNVCALQGLTAILADANAGSAFISLFCPECAPVSAWLTTVTATITANVANLQYAAQGCGGAYLDISFDGGWRFEPACGT